MLRSQLNANAGTKAFSHGKQRYVGMLALHRSGQGDYISERFLVVDLLLAFAIYIKDVLIIGIATAKSLHVWCAGIKAFGCKSPSQDFVALAVQCQTMNSQNHSCRLSIFGIPFIERDVELFRERSIFDDFDSVEWIRARLA